jgi:hypothetical protein
MCASRSGNWALASSYKILWFLRLSACVGVSKKEKREIARARAGQIES